MMLAEPDKRVAVISITSSVLGTSKRAEILSDCCFQGGPAFLWQLFALY